MWLKAIFKCIGPKWKTKLSTFYKRLISYAKIILVNIRAGDDVTFLYGNSVSLLMVNSLFERPCSQHWTMAYVSIHVANFAGYFGKQLCWEIDFDFEWLCCEMRTVLISDACDLINC